MTKEELYKKEILGLKIVSVGDGVITFEDNSKMIIKDHHDQDCCENVYADWSDFKYVQEHLKDKRIKSVSIVGISGEGFIVRFGDDWSDGAKVFIPCYNSQNGYYSSDLSLEIEYKGTKTTVDISAYVEDKIF